MAVSSSTNDLWLLTLEHVRLRNGAVEITGETPDQNDQLAPTYRARLLDFGEQGLIVERPQHRTASKYIFPESFVRVLIIEREQRWELHTRVRHFTDFQLNVSTQLPAVELSYPYRVQNAQRRQFFRACTAGLDVGQVHLTPAITGALAANAPETYDPGRPVSAIMMNIGGGGIGLEIDAADDWLLDYVRDFHCHMRLPDITEPVEVEGRVVHIQPNDLGRVYIGLIFNFADHIRQRYTSDQICRFTTWVQRQHLRNQRQRR